MTHWKLCAEHIPQSAVPGMIQHWQQQHIDVPAAWMDETLSRVLHVIVLGTQAQAEAVQHTLHELNRGAQCTLDAIPQAEAEPYL